MELLFEAILNKLTPEERARYLAIKAAKEAAEALMSSAAKEENI